MEYPRPGPYGPHREQDRPGSAEGRRPENLPTAHALMDRALEHGINYLDTSNTYGLQDGDDWSENVIGRWSAQGGARRERTVLAAKLYQPSARSWRTPRRLAGAGLRPGREVRAGVRSLSR